MRGTPQDIIELNSEETLEKKCICSRIKTLCRLSGKERPDLQLVRILVDQLDKELKPEVTHGPEFTVSLNFQINFFRRKIHASR